MARLVELATALSVAVAFGVSAQAQEKVTFASTDADLNAASASTITGYLYRPEGAGPFPAVIGLHGCNGLVELDGKVSLLYGAWGEILAKEGYLVLLPDAFGSRGYGDLCGTPYSVRPIKPDREMPRDSYGALAYLRTRPDVQPNSIAILGQSFGAVAMFHTIADDARPKELSPEQDFRAAVAFYPNCRPFLAREPKWKPRQPLLFLMGEADNFTPAAPCKELLAAVAANGSPPVEAHWYSDAYHAFDHPDLPKIILSSIVLPPDGHSPTIGTNREARADAILRVKTFLGSKLR